jgi:Domain of unknown function (DUF4440)
MGQDGAMDPMTEVLAAAEERARALAGADDTALRALLHRDFGWTSHTGERFDLESYVRSNKAGRAVWHGQGLRDPAVVVVADTAVLTCVVVDEVDLGDGVRTFTMPMTQTWVRSGGRWLLLAGHAGPRLD